MLSLLCFLLLAPRPALAEEPPRLEVVSWNTWGMPFPFARSPRRSRFPHINRRLAALGADIAALQEVWRGARPLLSLPGAYWPLTRPDSGLALLTAHPTTPPRLHPFTEAHGVDRLKKKGVLTARVEIGDQQVWVVNTHLQAGTRPGAVRARSAQVDQLIEVVSALDGPAVVLGDFNLYDRLPSDVEASRRLQQAGLIDLGAQSGPTHTTESDRLDRILVRPTDEVPLTPEDLTVLPAQGMSDHRPVAATLRLDRQP